MSDAERSREEASNVYPLHPGDVIELRPDLSLGARIVSMGRAEREYWAKVRVAREYDRRRPW